MFYGQKKMSIKNIIKSKLFSFVIVGVLQKFFVCIFDLDMKSDHFATTKEQNTFYLLELHY